MSLAAFDAFCRHLCEALGQAPPDSRARDDASAAISITYREVSLVLAPSGSPFMPQVTLLVDFGEVPEHEQAEVYPALLQANFMMLEGGAPSFSLHPATARVTYQITFSLEQADPRVWCGALDGIVDAVLEWRETRCLPGPSSQADVPHAGAQTLRA